MKIAIGNDHAGPEYKKAIVKYLEENGHTVINFGTDTNDSVDYPDFIHPVAKAVENNEVDTPLNKKDRVIKPGQN